MNPAPAEQKLVGTQTNTENCVDTGHLNKPTRFRNDVITSFVPLLPFLALGRYSYAPFRPISLMRFVGWHFQFRSSKVPVPPLSRVDPVGVLGGPLGAEGPVAGNFSLKLNWPFFGHNPESLQGLGR